MHWRNREIEMIKNIMKTQVFSSSRVLECFFVIIIIFFLLRKCPLHMLLVMFFIHLGKLSNSRSQMFFKAGVLKNFAIFAGKRLCWRLFLIKLQTYSLQLYKKRLQHWYFSVKFAMNTYFEEHLQTTAFWPPSLLFS